MRIDQFLPDFAPHDAIGNHVLQLRRVLRDAGYESDIWADIIHPPVARQARHYREHPPVRPGAGDLALYHASTYSDMAGWLAARAGAGDRLVVYYHNITPAEYFARWEPVAAEGCGRARRELASLAPSTELAMAASAYNQAELLDTGYRSTVVSPLLVDLDEYHAAPDSRAVARHRARGGTRWLFVGRLAPNKCQHDVIGAFAAYRRAFDPAARLVLAGAPASARYLRALERLVADLELGDSVELPGGVPFGELVAQFASADVFVCCSEHEGFCVPLIEAMELGVPVVAYAAAAIPETVGDAGVLLEDKDPLTVAVAVGSLLSDRERRESLVRAGRARAGSFSLPLTSKQFLGHLDAHLRGS